MANKKEYTPEEVREYNERKHKYILSIFSIPFAGLPCLSAG